MRHFISWLICCTVLFCRISVSTAQVEGPDEPATSNANASNTPFAEAQQLFREALQAEGEQRVTKLQLSYLKLEEAAAADDNLAPPRTLWAKFLLSANDQDSARVALQLATAQHSEDPEAFVLMANLATISGQLAEAGLLYDRAADLLAEWKAERPRRQPLRERVASGRATLAQALAGLVAQQGDDASRRRFEDAEVAALKEWAEIAPQNPLAQEHLGDALLRSGDRAAAAKAFEKARALNPALPVAELRLARTLFNTGNREPALDYVRKAVASYPDDLLVRVTAGELLLTSGDQESAKEQIDAALQLDDQSLAGNLLLAVWLRCQADWEKAAEVLQTLSNRHPADFETSNLLALTLSELPEIEAKRRGMAVATVTAQRFADLKQPIGRRARISLAWTAFAAGDTLAARTHLNELLEVGFQASQISGDEAYYVSRLLVELGRADIAKPLLKNILDRKALFPKQAAAQELFAGL